MNPWFGTAFHRNTPWFGHTRAWAQYLQRCHFMLQQGEPVADTAVYIGDFAPQMTGPANPVPPGGIFFEKGAAMGRFKLLGSEKRMVMNEAIQAEEEITFVRIEDQRPNKKGDVYEIPASFRAADQGKHTRFDRTAVLTLEALGLAGQEFRAEENTAFALPPGDAKKLYRMKEVTPERIVIEFNEGDGKVQTYEIMKSAASPVAP